MIGRVHDSGGRAQNGKSPATLEILSLNGKYLFLDMPKIRRFEAFDNTDGLNRGSIVKYHWENNVLKLKPDNGYAFSLFLHFVVISLIVGEKTTDDIAFKHSRVAQRHIWIEWCNMIL